MERKIIDYLPLCIQDFAEMTAIMDSEQVEIERLWGSSEDVLNDQFVVDATENGVKRWENILGLKPKANYTLDERKFNILTRLNEQLPYTLNTLKSMLSSLCGSNGYSLKIDNDKYILIVKLALSNVNNFEMVEALLDKVVPANIVKTVLTFNSHYMLSGYTHEQLRAFTHKELREEII